MANYEPENRSYTPSNFIAGTSGLLTDVRTAGAAIKKHAPVKLSSGQVVPVTLQAATGASDYSAATAAVYTLNIASSFTAGDTITVDSVVYTAVASDAAGNQFVAGTASAVGAALKALLAADTSVTAVYTVGGSGANITFTQKAAGSGDSPTVETSVTDAAAVTTTTAYVAGVEPTGAHSAQENTVSGLFGIAAAAAESGKDCVVYLSGEFFGDALDTESGVTSDMLKDAFRDLSIILQ